MKIDLKEKVGMIVDGKQIILGDTIETAKSILGKCNADENNFYFCDGAFLILTDDDGSIDEIEVRNMDDKDMYVFFREMDIFREEKEAVLNHISACNGEALLNEDCEYYANNLGIVFSFDLSEEEIEELIRESKADGVYEDMRDSIEQDIYRSKHIGAFLIKRDQSM